MEIINGKGLVKLWAEGVRIEDQARDQLMRTAALPFIHKWVAAMPDCHWGMGAAIGSVIPTENVIIPAAVGVDIGCGIAGWRTGVHGSEIKTEDLPFLRRELERRIPHGRTNNGGPGDRGAWHNIPCGVSTTWHEQFADEWGALIEHTPRLERANTITQLGTLGTGNHFIEYATDQQGYVWILVHSGSRGAGAAIANHGVKSAKDLMKKYWIKLEDPHLSYLPQGTPEFDTYMNGMFWAQKFAATNRRLMLERALSVLEGHLGVSPIPIEEKVETPHNFVARERHFGKDVWVTRKGACRARFGDRIVIPGSMGERTYVVTGQGNRDAFESCSHGAGRAMSRTEARKTFDLEHHIKATSHVECRKDEGVLDETPGSYKDIDQVMLAQTDLVESTHVLTAFINMKG